MVKPRRLARRIVVDGRLRVPLYSQLVRTARQVPVLIATTEQAAGDHPQKVDALRDEGCEVLALPQIAPGRIDLNALLSWCGGQQMTNVMVEGGGHLIGQFLDARLADELAVFIAPILIGGGAPAPAAIQTCSNPVPPPAGEPFATSFRSGTPLFPESAAPFPAGRRSAHAPVSSGPRGPGPAGVAAVTPWPGGVHDLAGAPRLRRVRLRQLGPDLCLQGHIVWP